MNTTNVKITDKIVSDRAIIREMEVDELIDFISKITDSKLIEYAMGQLKTLQPNN